jgi:hypothetical protein
MVATSDRDGDFCRVYSLTLVKGSVFAECLVAWHSTKKASGRPLPIPLPRVLGGTRQRGSMCRVPAGLALGKEVSSGPLWQFHRSFMISCEDRLGFYT